jgi:hypothetical protein
VSCGSPANCVAVGFYGDGVGRVQGFEVSQVHGRWRTVAQIPGLAQYGGVRVHRLGLLRLAG